MTHLAEQLRANHARFVATIERIPASRLESHRVCGDWTARDLCTHLAAWNEEITDAIERQLKELPRQPHHPIRDVDAFNARSTARPAPWEEVFARLDRSVGRAVALAAPLSDAELAAPSTFVWGPTGTLRAHFRGVDEHALEHLPELEKATGR